MPRGMTAQMRRYLGDLDNRGELLERYDALHCAQEILPSIADGPHYEPEGLTLIPGSTMVSLYTMDGIIGASGCFLNAIQGVPVDRIRRCAICSKIFYRRRKASECCSERCRKTYNKRRSRAAHKALESAKLHPKKGR